MLCLYACGGEQGTCEYPLGLGFLKANVDADIRIVKHLTEARNADILGLSANAWGLREAKAIRADPTWPTVVLGGQGALWNGLDDGADFDFVVRGDGELALQAIVDGFTNGKVITMRVPELDALNPPERGTCTPCIPIVTSRGCPFHCTFCSSHAQWGAPRFHSIGWVMNDINECVRRYRDIKEFNILDDLWAYPLARFQEFRDAWMKAGYHKRFQLRGFIRSNMADKKMFLDMKKMGFSRIRFGAESGSDRILKLVSKGETIADHQRAIDLAQEVGFPISASFMRGIPGETAEDLAATQAFIARNKGKLLLEGSYVFRAFPGATLWSGESPLTVDMRVR